MEGRGKGRRRRRRKRKRKKKRRRRRGRRSRRGRERGRGIAGADKGKGKREEKKKDGKGGALGGGREKGKGKKNGNTERKRYTTPSNIGMTPSEGNVEARYSFGSLPLYLLHNSELISIIHTTPASHTVISSFLYSVVELTQPLPMPKNVQKDIDYVESTYPLPRLHYSSSNRHSVVFLCFHHCLLLLLVLRRFR